MSNIEIRSSCHQFMQISGASVREHPVHVEITSSCQEPISTQRSEAAVRDQSVHKIRSSCLGPIRNQEQLPANKPVDRDQEQLPDTNQLTEIRSSYRGAIREMVTRNW